MYKYLLLLSWLLVFYSYHLPPSYTKTHAVYIHVGFCFSFRKSIGKQSCALALFSSLITPPKLHWNLLMSAAEHIEKPKLGVDGELSASCAAQTSVCAPCTWGTGIAVRYIKAFVLLLPSTSLFPHFLCAFQKWELSKTWVSAIEKFAFKKHPSIPILCRLLDNLFASYQKNKSSSIMFVLGLLPLLLKNETPGVDGWVCSLLSTSTFCPQQKWMM